MSSNVEMIVKTHKLNALQEAMSARIIGQEDLIRSMILTLLCDGHMLIEGMPGLAKTTAAKTLADALEGNFYAYPIHARFASF